MGSKNMTTLMFPELAWKSSTFNPWLSVDSCSDYEYIKNITK